MSTDRDPARPFVDELFEDLEKRYKAPDPETIAGKVEAFERLLSGTLLPFVGINAFLVGSLVYQHQFGGILVPVFLASLLTAAWLLLYPRATRRTAWLHHGGLAALALMALLAVPNPWMAALLGVVWTIVFTVAVSRGALPERATVLYVVYLPLLAHGELPVETRVAFELLALVPMAATFLIRRLRVASLATITGAVVTGLLELSSLGTGHLGMAAFMAAFVVAAVVYEWRIPQVEASSLRKFAGHGLIVLLGFVALATLFDWREPSTWWLWASATGLFQVLQMTRERLADPTRAVWVALAVALCLWIQAPDVPWHLKVISTLALATAIQLLAAARNRRFPATVAVMLAASTAFAIVPRSQLQVSGHVVATSALLVAFLLLAARSRPDPEPVPWWRGFLRAEHTDWVRRCSLGVLGQVLRFPFIATLFQWLRIAFAWLKYLKGGIEPFSLADLMAAAAHVLAALIVTNQLALLLVPQAAANRLAVLIPGAVWSCWGLGLSIAGSIWRVMYYRLLGVAFLIYPLVAIRAEDPLIVAVLAIIAGFAMWLSGVAAQRLPPAAVPDAAEPPG